jgi:O-antigen/teichoic acid export membrane protein
LGIYQSQPMIITQLLGPAEVTIFVIAYKIIALPVDLAYMATVPFISAFSEARVRGDLKWIKDACKNSTLGAIAIGIPLVAMIAFTAKFLIRIWAGPATVPNSALVLWLSIYTLLGVTLIPSAQMLCGLERVGKLAFTLSICALGNIGFGILFGKWWGLSGIALAMAFSKAVTYWPILGYEIHRLLRVPALACPSDADRPVENARA